MPREWTSRPPGTKSVRVDLAERVHAKLRILAAEAGVAMSVFVRGLAEDAVGNRFPEVFEGSEDKPAPDRGKKRNRRKA